MSQTIMIIEDDEISRLMYSELLISENIEVMEAEDGKQALNLLQSSSKKPDLIVMDLTFPNMTPERFIEELKHVPETAAIPYIFVSGQSTIREKAEKLHATAYIKKPFDIDVFVDVVKNSAIH